MAKALPPVKIYDPHSSSVHTTTTLQQIEEIHRACVQQDHMLATILDVTHPTKLRDHWAAKHEQSLKGGRVIFLQFVDDHNDERNEIKVEGGSDRVQSGEGGRELAGVVTLEMPATETGPFRASVEKLMTSPKHRNKGVARALMAKVEEMARQKQRMLLLLDTEVGSPAESVYPKLGYKTIGTIPRYGISPKDGRLVDGILFYKDLRDEEC